jgi:hypothetical protein
MGGQSEKPRIATSRKHDLSRPKHIDHQKEQGMTSDDIKQNKEHLHHNQKAQPPHGEKTSPFHLSNDDGKEDGGVFLEGVP